MVLHANTSRTTLGPTAMDTVVENPAPPVGWRRSVPVGVCSAMHPTFPNSSAQGKLQSKPDGLLILAPSALCSGRPDPFEWLLLRRTLVRFADQLCPLVSLEFHNTLRQLVPAKAASVTWSVQQHLRNQTEQFPCSGLAQNVSHQLGTVSLPQSDSETLSHPAPEEMRATLQHRHPVEQLFLQINFVQLCPSSKNTVPWWCFGCCQCWLDPCLTPCVKHKSHVHGLQQRDPCVLAACATQENLLCTSSNVIAWLNCLKSLSLQPLRQTFSGNNAPRSHDFAKKCEMRMP